MAVNVKAAAYDQTMAAYDDLLERETLNFRNAERSGDVEAARNAFMEMSNVKAQKRAAEELAIEDVRSRMPPPPSQTRGGKFFMSDEAAKRAAAALSDDPGIVGMSEIEAAAVCGISEEEYARNKARLQWEYATGQRTRQHG